MKKLWQETKVGQPLCFENIELGFVPVSTYNTKVNITKVKNEDEDATSSKHNLQSEYYVSHCSF